MLIKEYEAENLKECLQKVRDGLGPDAVILETRKVRKGGMLGLGSRELVCVVAATGITVKSDNLAAPLPSQVTTAVKPTMAPATASVAAASASVVNRSGAVASAARALYGRGGNAATSARAGGAAVAERQPLAANQEAPRPGLREDRPADQPPPDRFAFLERAMREIRDSLTALQREQREVHERTVSAVVSAVQPSVQLDGAPSGPLYPCHELYDQLLSAGVNETVARDLMENLPDVSAWSDPARLPLAASALRDLISRRIPGSGPIRLTPNKLKAVALIGPTGVGKTTTIAKLAAHYSLVENKKVALLTVDTYRIAAVEQLKTYSQILDIPVAVAYSQSEVMPAIEQFADYDLILIDTAGRSQKNIMQVGELKNLLETLQCETLLVLSASTKEHDMLEAVKRFSAARVDRLIFSKLDETSSHGSLLNVADQSGIPLAYITTGQKVPEDIEVATGDRLAAMILP